ncbi:MAG: hypothetical protein WEG36_05935 [Gemmatimonadota bacterium]
MRIASGDQLLATVTGTRPYVVTVQRTKQGQVRSLSSQCTCPVGTECKHAVAVVVALLDALAEDLDVPRADPDDPRWEALAEESFGLDEDLDDEPEPVHSSATRGRASRRSRSDSGEEVRAYLRGRSADELAVLIGSLVQRYPEVSADLRERIALAEGKVGALVKEAHRDLLRVTAIQPWRNNWTSEREIPDYQPLQRRLEGLAQSGHFDEVVSIGRELIRRGIEQVGRADDEGDTAIALNDCLPVVFDAVVRSSLSGFEKLLFAVDALLEDDYEVVGSAADPVLDADYPPADWSRVADALADRLKEGDRSVAAGWRGSVRSFARDYERDRITDMRVRALEYAGRSSEGLPILESEARATGSYQRLVDHLIAEGEDADAARWAREGIEATLDTLPGIASGLAGSLCEMARRRKQWPVVAAHAAWRLFDLPSVATYQELCAAARKSGCLEAVRRAAERFLETGDPPIGITTSKRGKVEIRVADDWPLPVPDELAFASRRARTSPRPHYDVLMDLAIAAKRPEEVLRWYDRIQEAEGRSRNPRYEYGEPRADRVAAAVAESHPDRALAIYERALDAWLKEARPAAYEAAGSYLRRMRPIFKSLGRESEWKERVAELRETYRRRPRFLEVLDAVEGRSIVRTRKSRWRGP